MMKQIIKTVKYSVLLILIGCLCTAPTKMFAADSTSTPEIVYTEPEEYSFQGVLWNSGKGAALVLPDTAAGEWSSIQGDDNTGTVGGVKNNRSDVTITVYSGHVTYEPTLQGIYNYVKENGFQTTAYVSCNGAGAVRFTSENTSEVSLAFPWQEEVVQITVKAAEEDIRNRYADEIFRSVHIARDGDPFLYENLKGSLTEEKAYGAVEQYVQENFQGNSLSDITIERTGRTDEFYVFFADNGQSRCKIYVKAATGELYKEDIDENGNSKGYGVLAGSVFGYLSDNSDSLENIRDDQAELDSEAAYDAVYQYVDETLGVDEIYEFNGYVTMDEDTEDEYVIMVRSYTGANGWYYVQKKTGEVSVAWENPITNELDERQYLFTIGS